MGHEVSYCHITGQDKGDWSGEKPNENLTTDKFEPCFVFLFLVFAGGGKWSVDEQLARSRAR